MTNAQKMMTALGDPSRQAIVDALLDGPLPVGDIAAALPLSRPAVSQHLKVLKEVGLVYDRPVGTRRLYQVDPKALATLRGLVDQFWERSLAAYQQTIVDEEAEKP